MKYLILPVFAFIFSIGVSQTGTTKYEILLIAEDHNSGFDYPYLLYMPDTLSKMAAHKQLFTLLVVPNNTGVLSDSLSFHEVVARKQILSVWAKIANRLNTTVLMPIFPRSKKEPNIYSHALDRDAMVTSNQLLQLKNLMSTNSDILLEFLIWHQLPVAVYH